MSNDQRKLYLIIYLRNEQGSIQFY